MVVLRFESTHESSPGILDLRPLQYTISSSFGKRNRKTFLYRNTGGTQHFLLLSCAPSLPFLTPVRQIHAMRCYTLLNSGTLLTLFDHNLKINGYPGRDKVETMEIKRALGMLEWLQPLEVLWRVVDCSKFLLKNKMPWLSGYPESIRENRS